MPGQFESESVPVAFKLRTVTQKKKKVQLADLALRVFFPLAFQVSRVRSSGLKLTLQLLVLVADDPTLLSRC
jgi:hypothetical protein